MGNKKFKKISEKLSTNRDDYMSSFRHNVNLYIDQPNYTLRELSENSGIPVSTISSFLYGNVKDCKLSTAIALSKALGVSMDELVGAGTLSDSERECLSICRNLPENSLYLIQWYIKHQQIVNNSVRKKKKILSVMEPIFNHHGNLKLSDFYKHIDITDLDKENRSKVFFGLKIPCDNYMPYYSPFDILLIANDRTPNFHEHSLIWKDNSLFIANRKIDDGVAKYYSIRDNKFRFTEDEVDEVIGYISCVLRDNIKYCD